MVVWMGLDRFGASELRAIVRCRDEELARQDALVKRYLARAEKRHLEVRAATAKLENRNRKIENLQLALKEKETCSYYHGPLGVYKLSQSRGGSLLPIRSLVACALRRNAGRRQL